MAGARWSELSTLRSSGRDDRIKTAQADVAQLVEQPIRNRQVTGSSPVVGSMESGEPYSAVIVLSRIFIHQLIFWGRA